jgi:hypothetical protein
MLSHLLVVVLSLVKGVRHFGISGVRIELKLESERAIPSYNILLVWQVGCTRDLPPLVHLI